MKTTVIAVVLAAVAGLAAGGEAPNVLAEAERLAGWRLLFDGTSTAGFRRYRGGDPGEGWRVVDGALVLARPGAGDLVTRDEFESFELELEYRIAPGGNSGVMFHVTEEAAEPWMSGPEVQILDPDAGREGQRAGFLYDLYRPEIPPWVKNLEQAAGLPDRDVDASRPAGAWNHLLLRVTPESGEVCLNGVSYYRFKKGSADWDARVAKSKFTRFPGFGQAPRGHICLQDHGAEVAFRSIKIRPHAPGKPVPDPVHGSLPVRVVPAFPAATWEGWSPESEDGRPVPPLRPLLVTHAGDGSGRRFVLDQSGMIHVFAPGSQDARLFLDLRPKTNPWARANEDGLLGLAFHPRFAATGECFVCYGLKSRPRTEVVARFRVRPDDANKADPASEEVLLSIDQPFPNHNGGSIAFGPDGRLYVGLGDGGSRNDPFDNGQKLDTWLGKILRIDVDRPDPGARYGVPADNPFVATPGARPEIYALGFRNPWQIAFDRATGRLWAADVGQDLWEEIDVVEKGGNYGWSRFEAHLPFGTAAAAADTDWRLPVWRYDHQVGKSITGGRVYRGRQVPALTGAYVYGDHVTGRLWALKVDADTGGVSNWAIPWQGLPVFGFGEDEAGEIYVTTSSPVGQGVYRLEASTTSPH